MVSALPLPPEYLPFTPRHGESHHCAAVRWGVGPDSDAGFFCSLFFCFFRMIYFWGMIMFFFGGYRGFCKNGWILKISRGITIKIASRKRSFLFFFKAMLRWKWRWKVASRRFSSLTLLESIGELVHWGRWPALWWRKVISSISFWALEVWWDFQPHRRKRKWQVNSVNLYTQLFHPMTPEVIDGDVTTFFFRQDLLIRFYWGWVQWYSATNTHRNHGIPTDNTKRLWFGKMATFQ